MKKLFYTLVFCALLVVSPGRSQASGIPTVDFAVLAESILAYVQEYEELVQIIETYQLLEEEYAKWAEVIDMFYILESMDTDLLMKIFEEAGYTLPATANMGSPAILAGEIWGAANPPARKIYQKRSDFIHTNIGKVNKLHAAIVARQEKIRKIADDIADNTTETSDKELASIQAALLVEQTMMQNEQMLVQLLDTEVKLGIEALALEAEGSLRTKRSGLEDVK